jgi:hypothetical protein
MSARYYLSLWLLGCLEWAALWLLALPWPTWWPLAILAAWATADAGSYVFHVFLDHHLRPEDSPMAAGFQRHHYDQLGIVREPIPAVLAPVVPLLLPVWMLAAAPAVLGWLSPWWALYLCTLALGVGFGQLFHRWSHMDRPGRLIGIAQRARLLVGKTAHDEHHKPPHGSHYAIVSGWSNPVFDALGMDRLVARLAARAGFPRVVEGPSAEDLARAKRPLQGLVPFPDLRHG